MYDKIFKASTAQGYVTHIEGRIHSLNANKTQGYESEVKRLEFALADVISKMGEGELEALRAHQNKTMTPEEVNAERRRLEKAMAENRDKPSI